jgi:hypothetical protein
LQQSKKDKYLVSTKDFNVYKTNLYLNISLTEPADFGTYYCISKNEKGLTKAAIELFGKSIISTVCFIDLGKLN